MHEGTPGDNMREMYERGRAVHPPGERSARAVLTNQQAAEVKSLCLSGVSQRQVAREFGISQITVSRIVRGLRYREGGDALCRLTLCGSSLRARLAGTAAIYGSDGFGLLRALHEWGCDVYPQPTWLDVPVPHDLLPLFGKTLRPPFDLLINHWDPDHLSITREARQACRVAVAWSMWEFAAAPPEVKKPCRAHAPCQACGMPKTAHGQSTYSQPQHSFRPSYMRDNAVGQSDCPDCRHVDSGFYPHAQNLRKGKENEGLRERLQWFDMVLGYDEVSLSAFAPFIPSHVHGGVLQGGYESKLWKPVERDWHGDRFQFIMHGALNQRKAPWTAIQAWHKLKAEKGEAFAGARLALHTSLPGVLFPELNPSFEHVGIKVFCSAIDMAGLRDFYAAGHCLLAPSRGEGKNLPALEFMTTGGAVAATNFGGHVNWLSDDWAYPLDYQLGPTFASCPWGAHDAKVSEDHLADVIWHIYTHREEARQKALRAQEVIPKMCDWSVVVENLFRRIRDTVTSNNVGPQVYDKAMACRRGPEELAAPGGGAGLLHPYNLH